MDQNIPKPIPRAPEIDWEDYLNQRIVWDIDLSKYGVHLNASVAVYKRDKRLLIYIEIDSNPGFYFQLSATTYNEDNKKLKSNLICGYAFYKGFTIEVNILPYRRLADIDKIVISGIYFEHNTQNMSNIKNRPTEFSPKEDWEKYLNSRIEWKIPFAENNIDAKANISYNETSDCWEFYIELSSQTKQHIEIHVAFYDNNNNIKYCNIIYYDTLDNFWVTRMCPSIKRFYTLDKIVIYGTITKS